jgi:hypothetical protein
MPHDLRILEMKGCGPDRLRKIFTSVGPGGEKYSDAGPSSPQENLTSDGTRMVPYQGEEPKAGDAVTTRQKSDWEIRCEFEREIRSRTLAGIALGISNSSVLQAVDMAWDAAPIQKQTVPLMLWAQGKIKTESLCGWFLDPNNCTPETARKFVKKGSDGKPSTLNIPRICEVAINLPRSYVTRRHAAIAALWDNLYPLLRYDPRGTSQVDQLQADVVTQLVDIMAEEYNYRHFLSQCDRDKLLYSESLIFPRAAWDRKTSWRFKKSNVSGKKGEKSDAIESYVTQEGVDPSNPHKSRWFYDLSAPLANINTNNGPGYLGYWTIVPFSTIWDSDEYYNRKQIVISAGWLQLITAQQQYFAQYFDPCVLNFPELGPQCDPALRNDRVGNIGVYNEQMKDKGCFFYQYFVKVNPKVRGIGDYDADVWMRISAAGDGTIVGAEFLPSIPACYGGINCNDNRVANASLASEMLAFQDMVTNILTTMIEQVRRSFTQLWVFNRDFLDEAIVKELEDNAANREWWIDPKVLTMSFSQKEELLAQGRFDPAMICFKITMELQTAVSDGLRALGQIIAFADRIVNSSPNELGQPNPREVAAREVQEISTSIQSIYAFYNQGPREQRAAFKRLVYESLRACGTDRFRVPVLGRYSLKTIKEAGFEVENPPKGVSDDTVLPEKTVIVGNLSDLDFDCQFTSRDGAERPANTQGAQVLQQLFMGLLQVPGAAEQLGKRRIFEVLNIIARMAGAPDEFMLKIDDGEEDAMGEQTPPDAMPPPVQKAIEAIMQAMQQMAMKDSQIEQVVSQIAQKVGLPMPAAQAPTAPPQGQPPAGGPPSAPNGAAAPEAAPPAAGPARNGAALLSSP